MFLSTPPSRVATSPFKRHRTFLLCFYPRHPRGWRLRKISLELRQGAVSIHATLAGGDIYPAKFIIKLRVSIHATLAGGDKDYPAIMRQAGLFLSTPPSRVATILDAVVFPHRAVSIHATLAGGDPSSLYSATI